MIHPAGAPLVLCEEHNFRGSRRKWKPPKHGAWAAKSGLVRRYIKDMGRGNPKTLEPICYAMHQYQEESTAAVPVASVELMNYLQRQYAADAHHLGIHAAVDVARLVKTRGKTLRRTLLQFSRRPEDADKVYSLEQQIVELSRTVDSLKRCGRNFVGV